MAHCHNALECWSLCFAQGSVCAWGAAEFGQLGLGNHGPDQPIPKTLKIDKGFHFVRYELLFFSWFFMAKDGVRWEGVPEMLQ